MQSEIFFSALGGALGGGLVVFLFSFLPNIIEASRQKLIQRNYSENIDSIISTWGEYGSIKLPSGLIFNYDIGGKYDDRELLSFTRLLKDCIIREDWFFFKKTIELFDKIYGIKKKEWERQRKQAEDSKT